MVTPLHITFRNIRPSATIEAEVRRRAEKLGQFSDRIIHCEVTIEADGKHRQQGWLYEVRIDMTVPGKEIVACHNNRHEDVLVAIREAFDAAIRQLQEFMRYRRG